ncbi:MAG: cystathionine gamma-synthase family protein [Deltaproteobacteria bacterium]|nr:cystathionine gamma-synthase family protein [Deltaproteobacteria bacterium]
MKRRRKRPPEISGMRPESLMMSHGYRPEDSEGAVKPPVFQTSTFAFRSAEEGKEFFSWAYGLEERDPKKPMGLIYSRLNNPDLEILEDRLNLWDGAEESAVFGSGMAAISTSLLALVPVGQSVVFSRPVYGGTDYLMEHILPSFGIPTREFPAGGDPALVDEHCRDLASQGTPCSLVFLETPANPTIMLTDIEGCARAAHRNGALCAVDNTFLGPLYQSPLELDADLVLYSATKYLGGHCDLLAGAALGSSQLIAKIKALRTILGTMLDPHSAWLLLRSLETAKLRMTCSRKNAERVAAWLRRQPQVSRVHFAGFPESEDQKRIYERQCKGPGGLIAFELAGAGEAEAFRFLNSVRMIKLAVSLGGTESLIEHPSSMTHADVPVDEQLAIGITPGLVRLSVGIEHPDDIIADLAYALDQIETVAPVSVPGSGRRTS